METNLSKLKEEIKKLIDSATLLYYSLLLENDKVDAKTKKELLKLKLPKFASQYEVWYSEALQVVKQLIPDRLDDFIRLYKNEKRKEIDWLTYTISDYLIGLQVTRGGEIKCDGKAAIPKFQQQMNILESAGKRFESSLFDLKQIVQADIFDDELETADELLKNGFVRAAGAIAGVVLENHFKIVCDNHKVTLKKKNPSISDYNDTLKNSDIIEVNVWRFIQYLGDIRNLCDHSKEKEPTKEQVTDLIAGVKKITKTVL
ncbi:MAG: hypothetical protein JL50_10410 [Peptococcaceae bacterium BICA1-7]|nr:MAG: hypothetical protein JL50_10410 [Peptococcaceae bacterium BICA1-7]HBV95695.1 hypothetical protein [Desulfotomaculum sp.]